jgi:hypothetical protein
MRFAFIRAHASQYRITTMCRVLQVSKAGCYAWETRAPSARTQETQALLTQITVVHRASQRRYVSPRVDREQRGLGRCVSRKRVARTPLSRAGRSRVPYRLELHLHDRFIMRDQHGEADGQLGRWRARGGADERSFAVMGASLKWSPEI